MDLVKYDEEADALYVSVSSKKASFSVEISPRIVVDLSSSNKAIGVEVLDASNFIGDLFGFKVTRADLKKLDCIVNDRKELLLKFELGGKRQNLILPKAYKSPVLEND